MNVTTERRMLQAAIATACLVPLLAGGAGMIVGLEMLGVTAASPDLASHYRYMSGLLFGIGLGFLSCVPRIEAQRSRMRLLGLIVLVGGLARAWSLVDDGTPSLGHRLALVMELGVVPALVLWQWRFAGRWQRAR
jgi:hypothetical protein